MGPSKSESPTPSLYGYSDEIRKMLHQSTKERALGKRGEKRVQYYH